MSDGAKLFFGKPCVEAMNQRISSGLQGKNALLCTIGFDDGKWNQYTESLSKSADKYGCQCRRVVAPSGVLVKDFSELIAENSADPNVTGVIVQQPLPKVYGEALSRIDVKKDLDCLNPLSVAAMYNGDEGFRPATPSAVIALLKFYGEEISGKRAVIVGRGNAVGKPLALMLLAENATVTVCHTKTRNLPEICRSADILVSACGVSGLITPEFVNENAVVIDVGLSFVEGKSRGDVSDEVYKMCRAVSPVPGGIGPVTRAFLFENLLKATKLQ